MSEQVQLYDEQGRPLAGQGAVKEKMFAHGLLHGASHVWIWRRADQTAEVLLQKRAARKKTWPNLLDISAAGHLQLGEDPLAAALREAQEEIGLAITETNLRLISVERRIITAPNGAIENEFCWIYLLELAKDMNFVLHDKEVASLQWKKLDDFAAETRDGQSAGYVPQGAIYFARVVAAIESEL